MKQKQARGSRRERRYSEENFRPGNPNRRNPFEHWPMLPEETLWPGPLCKKR